MSGFAQCSHIFGVKQNVANAPLFQDEHTILLPAGGQIVRYRLDGLPQKFVANNQSTQKGTATAIALSHTRRHLAVAEHIPGSQISNPHIIIYDLLHDTSKRQRVLQMPPDTNFQDIVSMDFSPDGKYLIAQGAQPDWTLCMWLWEKNKLLSTIKSTNPAGNPVTQVSFNPTDPTQICVTGQNIFKFLRFTEGHMKQHGTQKVDPRNYTSHSWLSGERLVVTCENGKTYILENGDVKDTIDLSKLEEKDEEKDEESDGSSVSTDDFQTTMGKNEKNGGSNGLSVVASTQVGNGFAVSTSSGMTYLYEAEDTKGAENYYRMSKSIKLSENSLSVNDFVTTMTVSPVNEFLIALTSQRELVQFSLASAHLESNIDANWKQLGAGNHAGPIMDMSVCSRKPLVATCAQDNTLRIWNYETHQCEISKRFAEDMSSCSLHPNGLHILIGFSDKLRLMNLLIDDVRVYREFPIRGCRLCSFSNGGHLFAVVHGHVIMIYSTSTFEVIQNLQGHSQKVRCLSWSPNDQILVSCGSDGAIYQWNPVTGQRINEVVNRGVDYTSVAIDGQEKIWACSTDGQIREIKGGEIARQVKIDQPLTCIGLSGKLVFGTTANGTIRAISQPLTDPCEFNEFSGHSDLISKLVSTMDNKNLITASNDGSIIVWNSFEANQKSLDHGRELYKQWAEEVLVSRSDLEEKNREIVELKTRVDELKMETEYQLRLKQMKHDETMQQLTEKFMQEMESLKLKSSVYKTEKEKQASAFEEEMVRLNENHDREIVDLEQSNNQKLMFEYERYQELQAKSQKMQTDYENRCQELEEDKENAIERLSTSYEQKLQELTNQLKQQEEERRQAGREHEETKRQIEEDTDREICELRQKYEKQLRDRLEENMQLKLEAGILNKKFSGLNKVIEQGKQDKRKLQLEIEKLNNVIKGYEKDMVSLRKEIQERDETINEKEKRIYDLKKKNQELEKFKFVLDYKIKELKKQIEPRENEIKSNKEQINEMESELERFHKANTSLELEKTTLKQKLRACDADLQGQRQKVRNKSNLIKSIKIELHKCAGKIQEPQELKKSVTNLHAKYCSTADNVASKNDAQVDTSSQEEKSQQLIMRQREHLERSLASLRTKMGKDNSVQKQDHIRIMQENVHLISEINDLRKELKGSRVRIGDLETALGVRRGKKNNKNAGDDIIKDDTTKLVEQQNEICELQNVISRQATQLVSMKGEKEVTIEDLKTKNRELEKLAAQR